MDAPPSASSPAPSLFRRPVFWIAFALLSVACAVVSIRLFPQAFPVVTVDIQMDREHALASARALAIEHTWGPDGDLRAAATFGVDSAARSFVELEGGGASAFRSLLSDPLFSPYTWSVRLFRESETRQVVVAFKPSGAPYAFSETLREQAPGAALSADAARAIAEDAARAAPWNLPLDRFDLVESSQHTQPGGRVDHTFIYERPDLAFGEGRLRLRLVVGGDRLTALEPYLQIPEAFERRFEKMRSANNAIAGAASIVAMLGYLLIGGAIAFALLLRQRALLWRQPLAWAALLAGLQLLADLNAWPLAWLGYDTAESAGAFIVNRVAATSAQALGLGFVFFVSFLAAEGLSRRAFPHHPQFWRIWSRDAAPSPEILGRTLGGYLFTSISLLYVLVFYYVAIRQLGWWTPSEALVDPDSLAHVFPWLTPLARSAQAGFWEETLFRALPLSAAALLGSRFGGRRAWIAAAFLLQAVVFAAAHANYPGQPSWSRVVELLFPSFIFAALFLRFGLLPAIVLHFIYDVVLMSLPLFAASAAGIWIDRSFVVLLSLVPLWVVLYRRWRAGRFGVLPASLRNAAWRSAPPPPSIDTAPAPPPPSSELPRRTDPLVLAAGALGFVVWLLISPATPLSPFQRLGPPLEISRTEAIALARAELERRGIQLPNTFHAFAKPADRPWDGDRFAWQTAGPDVYRELLGRHLPENRWLIRFASFEGDIAERAEEWRVFLDAHGAVHRVAHVLPEARPGSSLTEADARGRVHAALRDLWQLDPAALSEVSATSQKRPNRTDWSFVFKNPAITSLAPGDARLQVELSGDELTDAFGFVFIPEDWERANRDRDSKLRIARIVRSIAQAGLIIASVVLAIVAWTRGKFAARLAFTTFGLLFVCMCALAANNWPAIEFNFSTAQPLPLQRTIAIIAPLIGGLLASAAFALLGGYVVRLLPPSSLTVSRAARLGLALGLAFAGASATAAWLRLDQSPPWPPTHPAGTFSPFVGAILESFSKIVSQSAIFLVLLALLNRLAHRRTLSVVVAFLSLTLLFLPTNAESLAAWLAETLVIGTVLTLVYLFLLRRGFTIVPFAIAALECGRLVGGALLGGYARALPVAFVGAITLLATAWLVTRTLHRAAASS